MSSDNSVASPTLVRGMGTSGRMSPFPSVQLVTPLTEEYSFFARKSL
jgi:hypothetical protein